MHIQRSTISAFIGALLVLQGGMAFGQEENLQLFDGWREWSNGKTMLVEHLNDQAFDLLDARDAEVEKLKTKADWTNRQKKVHDILFGMVGPFPEKTPLNAKVTGKLKEDNYRIEKIVFQSMPGFYVTGGLYLPDGAKGKSPAILFVSGHTMDAFRYPSYQAVILSLVKKGFVVFAIDPLGQGERIQHYDAEKNASSVGSMTREHSYLGNQCLVSGSSVAKYFIWDGIRAVDYLLTRREVDPSRIGVTGQSGGGTQAAYLFAFDERIRAAAVVNYVTGFRRLLQSIGPQDGEQNFYHGLLNGITHADLLEVRAPSPVLIAAGTRDFFSIQGARESYAEAKKAYAAFGAEESIVLIEDDWGHGFTTKLGRGVTAFFQEHLNLPGDPQQEELPSDGKELKITTTGQVATSFEDAETVFTINKKESKKLIDALEASRKNIGPHLDEAVSNARKLCGYVKPAQQIKSVFRGRYPRDGYSVEMYALHGEGDYVIPLLLFVPEGEGKFPAMLYLHPEGKIADAATGGKVEQLVKKGYIVAAPDVIGTGETAGIAADGVAMLIGRSMVGIQAGDIARVVNFIQGQDRADAGKIGAIAFDEMGPVLLHAAAFDNSIASVWLVGTPLSYRSMVENKIYDMAFFRNAVAGALTAYDLPDLIGSLAPRRVTLVEPKDQMKTTASTVVIDEALSFSRKAYTFRKASVNIRVLTGTNDIIAVIAPGLK